MSAHFWRNNKEWWLYRPGKHEYDLNIQDQRDIDLHPINQSRQYYEILVDEFGYDEFDIRF